MKRPLLLLLSFASASVYAQEQIDAERPGESLSPKTLSKNSFQAEIGFQRTKESKQDRIWRTPDALLRYGLIKKLELRLETIAEDQKIVSEGIYRKGVRPVELGLKVNLIETRNERFTSSIVGQVGVPKLASEDHKAEKAFHRIRLLFENKFSDKLMVHYNIGSDWDSKDQEQNWMYSFDPELQIGEKCTTFVEVYGFLKKDKIPENTIDAGFAYFISKNSQVDLSAGRGLNSESPNYFVAVGLCIRFGEKQLRD